MDNLETVLAYFSQYGYYFLFLIVFLEYLNLPGLPAGIIMPAAGLLVARHSHSFPVALAVSVAAGLLGSLVLYLLGRLLDSMVISRLYDKHPKFRPYADKTLQYMMRYGDYGVFVARLIPVARTLISLVAGTLRVGIWKFLLFSTGGITIWNAALIFAGYAFGDMIFR